MGVVSCNKNSMYTLGEQVFKVLTDERVLGLIIPSNLKFSKHCLKLVKQVKRRLGFIANDFMYKSKYIIFYNSIITPKLNDVFQCLAPLFQKTAVLERF